MNNYITLYGTPLQYPHQVSVDKHGTAYYGFKIATERPRSGIKDITKVIVEEGTEAFKSLVALDYEKDLLDDVKLLVTGRICTRNLKPKEKTDGKKHAKLNITVRADTITDQQYEGDTNGVVLTGYVCKIGEMRSTPRGMRITDMIIACDREDIKNVSDYIPAITWNGNAARAALMLEVGNCIEVRGRLQSREYIKRLEDETEETRTCYELSIEKWKKVPDEQKREA